MESIPNSKKFQETKMELPIALGKTITNEVFMVDLAKIPHLLVAGATGRGKSVGLNAIITSLLYKKHPNELKLVLIDPKKVEFSVYSRITNKFMAAVPDEEEPIITDVTKVVRTLNSLCVLMDSRYDLLKKAGARNIKEYNQKYVNHRLKLTDGHEFMPYIVVIIDEFGDLIMTAGKGGRASYRPHRPAGPCRGHPHDHRYPASLPPASSPVTSRRTSRAVLPSR